MNTDHIETEDSSVQKNTVFLGVGLAIVLATAAFFSGLHIGSIDTTNTKLQAGLFSFFATQQPQGEEIDLTEFWHVWDLLEEKYVTSSTSESITDQDRLEGAIAGLVQSYGDPYTVFLPPVDASHFEESIAGNFEGVGMEVGIRDGNIVVVAPLPNTPAENAGVVAQDIILEIDGVSTKNLSIDEAVKMIRGEKGTQVMLSVYREGEMDLIEIPIIRDTIEIPTIDTDIQEDVFIISLYSFNALADMQMQEALREYVQSGKHKLILDLRGNPGGFLQSSVSIASYFLPIGTPVVLENFGGDEEEKVYRSTGKTLKGYQPQEMIVLVDGGSASAAEILAGALQEHDAALLMGEQTFGKGSVQELISLPSTSSLKVTVARWFTPNGVSISDGGLTPDIIVERTPQQFIDGIDPQLDAAISYLNGDKTVGTKSSEIEQ